MSFLLELQNRLAQAQTLMRPDPIPGPGVAGVLIAFTSDADSKIILTRRADHLARHPGQIAFPGGMWEPQDANLAQTALRESHEEIGLAPECVQLIGALSARESRYGIPVKPFIGIIPCESALCPCEDEIHSIIEVPVSFFLGNEPQRYDRVQREGRDLMMPAWQYGVQDIWGLTGLMLADLLSPWLTYKIESID